MNSDVKAILYCLANPNSGAGGANPNALFLPAAAMIVGAGLQRVAYPYTLMHALGFAGAPEMLSSGGDDNDVVAPQPGGILRALAEGSGFDGVQMVRLRTASAANQAAAVKVGAAAIASVGNWSVPADPAAAVVASAVRAAGGAGVRHVCTSISASLGAGAAASGIVKVYLRDGAAGVGAILWAGNLQVPANDSRQLQITGLSIVGSINTAMTLEFSAAGPAGSQENVTLTGYSAS